MCFKEEGLNMDFVKDNLRIDLKKFNLTKSKMEGDLVESLCVP